MIWSTKSRSRSPNQGTSKVSTSRRSTKQGLDVEGLIVEEISNIDVKCIKVTAAQIYVKVTRSKNLPSQYIEKYYTRFGGCVFEEIWNVHVKCVKVTGAQNIGQGYWVKVPAESVHPGEALCKVWWL